MKTKYIPQTIVLSAIAALALAAPSARAEDGHKHGAGEKHEHTEKGGTTDKHAGHDKADVEIPETAAELWTQIDANSKALAEAVAAKRGETIHGVSITLEALVSAVPAKYGDLAADKAKRVQGQVKNTSRTLDALHHEADAGRWDEAAAKLTQIEAALKIIRQQTGG